MQDNAVTLSQADLALLLTRILEQNGCSQHVAAVLGQNCALCEAAGSISHGVFRMPGYVSTLASGWVDGKAVPHVSHPAPGFLRVDAQNGFAQPALLAARDPFTAAIRQNGIAILAIGGSHHFSALWLDVEPFADEGLVALSLVNSMACAVPVGAEKPLLGTNPFAFAAPVAGDTPFVFDFATTAMAHGDIQIAAREGHSVPIGTGLDQNRQDTTDPKAILDGGVLLPFGGHKGSAISLMIELLVAGLSGGHFSFGFDWSNHPGARSAHTGQIIIGIDPQNAAGTGFAAKARELTEALADAGLSLYPGKRRRNLATYQEGLVQLSAATYAELRGLLTSQ